MPGTQSAQMLGTVPGVGTSSNSGRKEPTSSVRSTTSDSPFWSRVKREGARTQSY